MKTKVILLSVITLIWLCTGCDTAQKRQVGSCVKSGSYGGPYRVVRSGWDLIVTNPQRTDQEKKVPNDNTWKVVDCP
jgi:hypothetical protein